jgi:hypothetical protein
MTERVVRVDVHEASLGLADDLLRHDDDITVGERTIRCAATCLGDEFSELVAGHDFR